MGHTIPLSGIYIRPGLQVGTLDDPYSLILEIETIVHIFNDRAFVYCKTVSDPYNVNIDLNDGMWLVYNNMYVVKFAPTVVTDCFCDILYGWCRCK